MFDTILDIPLHPLVVHAVVVLAPLTALLLVLFAATERLRVRIGAVLPVLATLTYVAAFVAEKSGEALRTMIGGGSDLVEAHEELGERLPLALLGVAVLSWLVWGAWRRGFRIDDSTEEPVGTGVAFRVLSVVGVVAAVGLTALVVLVGHSGAVAVWSGTGG